MGKDRSVCSWRLSSLARSWLFSLWHADSCKVTVPHMLVQSLVTATRDVGSLAERLSNHSFLRAVETYRDPARVHMCHFIHKTQLKVRSDTHHGKSPAKSSLCPCLSVPCKHHPAGREAGRAFYWLPSRAQRLLPDWGTAAPEFPGGGSFLMRSCAAYTHSSPAFVP